MSGGSFPFVDALAWDGTGLYAGGDFTIAGGTPALYIARWNGSSWSAVGSGMNNVVNALAWDGTGLYAGGDFTIAGGTPVNCIARWNGSSWSALGSGMSGGSFPFVDALAWDGTGLYAGGDFTIAGGTPANRIARWNGSSWSALGSGMNDFVYALAWDGTGLYAGGTFSTAGGTPANRIARWNPSSSSWSALGSGMSGGSFPYVNALAWDGTGLYAGGTFSTAGGTTAFHIARWNGSSWSALGSGMNNYVRALAWDGSGLYAGGDFTTAGGKLSNYTARWFPPPEVSRTAGTALKLTKGTAPGTVVCNFEDVPGMSGYNVYEGNLPFPSTAPYYSHGGAPGNVCNVTTTLAAGRRTTPAAGIGTAGSHYYLVTTYALTNEGPSGYNSSGVEIAPAQSTCPP